MSPSKKKIPIIIQDLLETLAFGKSISPSCLLPPKYVQNTW